MKRHPSPIMVTFGLLGAALLTVLVAPVVTLAFHLDAASWTSLLHADPRTVDAIQLTVVTSSASVAVMTLLGVPLGYVLARSAFPGRGFVICLIALPMVVPGLAGGILLLLTFGRLGVIGSIAGGLGVSLSDNFLGIVLAQVFVASPLVIISSMVAFGSVDERLEIAAATLGDSAWRVFRRISLPIARPAVMAGIVLAWVRALGEFGATMIVSYNPQTLPVHLWVRFQADGLSGAIPLAFVLVCLALGATVAWILLSRPLPTNRSDLQWAGKP